ncbi:hypothetical protein CONPUDRAFT_145129 [Coniophora puteana RWD-64-598 SS2]|uniref:DUF6533 domain-containing protein n=1 Tax=Coniophora puteana (strain RWD-64-598) TaxID=741705 RepID=A0A5M3MHZ5_CONPW|nr:uncharacterized protein CONPUDRAFT_145129 [Coniophora puteana RWD-64-598 SS2]EIW78858.1 hypothetical protein CONPUDRAFT_145129 [Coniophora puteana RWD-64-598 SS2]
MSASLAQVILLVAKKDQMFKRISVASTALVIYDYLLNLDLEVELIWLRKFSSTTVVYIILRYLGLAIAIAWLLGNLLIFSDHLSGSATPTPLTLAQHETFKLCQYLSAFFGTLGPDIIVFCVQGMMTARVYILLGKPRKTLLILLSCFTICQGFTFCVTIRNVGEYFGNLRKHTHAYCALGSLPCAPVSVVKLTSYLAYEFILGSFALAYASRQLPYSSSLWINPARSVNALMWVICRDHLAYIFGFFFVILLTIISHCLKLNFVISGMEKVPQILLFAVIGPWMIISLRRSYERNLDEMAMDNNGLTVIVFASVTDAGQSAQHQSAQ